MVSTSTWFKSFLGRNIRWEFFVFSVFFVFSDFYDSNKNHWIVNFQNILLSYTLLIFLHPKEHIPYLRWKNWSTPKKFLKLDAELTRTSLSTPLIQPISPILKHTARNKLLLMKSQMRVKMWPLFLLFSLSSFLHLFYLHSFPSHNLHFTYFYYENEDMEELACLSIYLSSSLPSYRDLVFLNFLRNVKSF